MRSGDDPQRRREAPSACRPSSIDQDAPQVLPQDGNLALQYLPYEVVINAEVLVNEPIPHAGHGAPFNSWILGASRGSDLYRGLPDDLEAADKRAL